MKAIAAAIGIVTLGAVGCAHGPEPYRFTAKPLANDLDVVVQTIKQSGLEPARIDRANDTVTTLWFDTGYRFREIDDFRNVDYPTDVYLRYRVSIERQGGEENVVLHPDVQRCAPTDSYVTAAGVVGSCQPMDRLFPAQQRQVDELGNRLRAALAGAGTEPLHVASAAPRP